VRVKANSRLLRNLRDNKERLKLKKRLGSLLKQKRNELDKKKKGLLLRLQKQRGSDWNKKPQKQRESDLKKRKDYVSRKKSGSDKKLKD